jgi:hypothetical protein
LQFYPQPSNNGTTLQSHLQLSSLRSQSSNLKSKWVTQWSDGTICKWAARVWSSTYYLNSWSLGNTATTFSFYRERPLRFNTGSSKNDRWPSLWSMSPFNSQMNQ